MAKSKVTTQVKTLKPTKKIRRPGIHAKTKTSNIKTSKLYTKKNKGQG